MSSTLLSTEDLSNLTGVPAETLRYWRWRGEGPMSFKIGRAVRYERADVDAWLTAQKAATSVPAIA